MFDVVIVGGGPAGLSAALALGRCRRRVLVCDDGRPRNAASRGLHGYLTRDGIPPLEFLRLGREELRRYPQVVFLETEIVAAQRREDRLVVTTGGGEHFVGRALFLATGVVDELPAIPGIEAFYGRSVHHCPFCDGWEHRDQPLAVYGAGRNGVELALKMRGWSAEVTLVPAGPLSSADLATVERCGIRVKWGRIVGLEGEGGALAALAFEDGSRLAVSALFFYPVQHARSRLAESLGCWVSPSGQIECQAGQATSVEGVYAMGNAACGLQLVIVAAAEGVRAAMAIDDALRKDDQRDQR